MTRIRTFRKRLFLNEISSGMTSYIFVEVESSQNGAYKYGNYTLRIADCDASLLFEFELGSPYRRFLSLRKLDRLVNTLVDFRARIHKEASQIEAYRPPRKATKKS